MRSVIAFAILMVPWLGAAPEPEYSALFTDHPQKIADDVAPTLIEIESSIGRSDRLDFASLQPHELTVETIKPENSELASIDVDADATADVTDVSAPTDSTAPSAASQTEDQPLADVCNALYTSAQNNDLPVAFFANLLWQESRLQDHAVSRKGALGIAQFMPKTAAETGLADPLDPMQAIPASARFLRDLRMEFGNLGFVAAAYNAGPRRVIEWLEHRSGLPQETRGYVEHVTGLSVEAWRKIAVSDDAVTFVRPLPCRSLPNFASVEQAHSVEAQAERAKLTQEIAQLDATAHREARKHDHAPTRHEAHKAPRERQVAARVTAKGAIPRREAAKRPATAKPAAIKREAAHRARPAHDNKRKTA